jgi:uncharacterized protein DUF4184
MPFTLSHPAVVLALRRTGLPVAGMVAGTMAPDVPMFLPGRVGYHLTHSLAGVVTADLLLGVVGVAVWVLLVRDALVDTAPAAVRERLDPVAPYSTRQWALLPVAVVLGAVTHVTWDLFTHPGRWGVRHVTWLQTEHLGVQGAHWAQTVSTLGGLALVVAWSAHHVASRPRRPRPARVSRLSRTGAPVVLLLAAVTGGLAALRQLPQGLHAVALHGAVVGTVALAAGAVLVALAWRLLRLP